MKVNFTRIVTIFIAIVLAYSSCTKDKVKLAPKSVVTDQVAGNIALQLYKSLTGQYGGANINDGIKAPSSVIMSRKGPVLYSANALCGYTIDTTFNNSKQAGDTAKTFSGSFRFVYTCDADQVNGYTVHDSLTNTETGTKFDNRYDLAQNYVVKALDASYKLVSMDGIIHLGIVNRVLSGPATSEYHQLLSYYNLKGLRVSFSSGSADIIAGKATFTTNTVDLGGTAPPDGTFGGYSGTIEYLGNHMAKLTIDGSPAKSYMVNLSTGAVTPI